MELDGITLYLTLFPVRYCGALGASPVVRFHGPTLEM